MCPALLAYHADDEIARAETIARLALLAGVVLVGVLAARRPAGDGRNLPARLALGLAAAGIAAWLVWRSIPTEDEEGIAATVWYALGAVILVAALVAPGLAASAFGRRTGGEPRLRALALAASLVLPAVGLGSAIACVATNQCFH